MPPTILDETEKRLAELNLGISALDGGSWFKIVEGVVINNQPIATARMYNYLVIAGLFRSISLIFLFALWMELAHRVLGDVFGLKHIGFFLSDGGGIFRWVTGYFILTAVYMFSLFSFLKLKSHLPVPAKNFRFSGSG